MGDHLDAKGYWARFCWCLLPLLEAKFPDEEPSIDITPMLKALYRNLENLPAQTYKLSKEARQLYGEWFKTLETLKYSEPNQAFRAVYSKT